MKLWALETKNRKALEKLAVKMIREDDMGEDVVEINAELV